MKLSAVKQNKQIKICDMQLIKRLGISGAVCLLVKRSKSFCVIEIWGRGQFAIEKNLADRVEVEYV